jgi:hypothetical protein
MPESSFVNPRDGSSFSKITRPHRFVDSGVERSFIVLRTDPTPRPE